MQNFAGSPFLHRSILAPASSSPAPAVPSNRSSTRTTSPTAVAALAEGDHAGKTYELPGRHACVAGMAASVA
ncbi:hypothetical protein [Blastococcus sp. SYSU DS0552]